MSLSVLGHFWLLCILNTIHHFLCSLCPSPFVSGTAQAFFKSRATGVSQKPQNKVQMSGISSKSLGYMSHSSLSIFTQRLLHLLQHSPVSFSCTFCLPQMPRNPSESRHLPWFILEAAPPHTRKRKIQVQRLGWREHLIIQLKIASWNIHSGLAFSSFSPWYPPSAVYNVTKHMIAVTWLFFT